MSVTLNRVAPAFQAETTAGPVSSSDLNGRIVVLYFYPKDATPGCTTEALAFRDHADAFAQANAIILGVSRDSLASHHRFKEKLGLPFELISDTSETVCKAYDVIKEKKLYGKPYIGIERSTFVIDTEGALVREWRGVKVPQHVEEVLEYVQSL